MDHPLRRLLVIAFLVSITFTSSAQNETLSEEDEDRILCLPGTTHCNDPHPGNNNPMLNEEAIADSPVEASGEEEDHTRIVCLPGTTHCNDPHPGNPKLNEEATAESPVEASGEEDASKSEASIICDPITKLCKGAPSTRIVCNPITHICTQPKTNSFVSESEKDELTKDEEATADSPVEASGEEDASKSEASIICDPITKLCKGAPSTRIVCNPITHICTQPKTNSFVSESEKDELTKDEEATADSPVEASGEEDASKSEASIICDPITKLCKGAPSTRIVCNPITHICTQPKTNSFVSESEKDEQTKDEEATADSPVEASGEEDASKSEASIICDPITKLCKGAPSTRIVCNPITHICTQPKTNSFVSESEKDEQTKDEEATADSPVEASGEEDASKSEASIICDPITKLCKGAPSTRIVCNPITHKCTQPKHNSIVSESEKDEQTKDEEATADSPVEASGEEDASKSEPSIICDPITKLCKGSPRTRIVCNPITHICTQPKHNSIVSESDKDEQTKDDSAIHEEEEKISPLVCDPKTGNCQEPHNAFGVAQPRDQVA